MQLNYFYQSNLHHEDSSRLPKHGRLELSEYEEFDDSFHEEDFVP